MDKKTENRQIREKSKVIQQLSNVPIIQRACKTSGISRSTYYRWIQEDEEFAKNTGLAIEEGVQLVNEMAESGLISLIQDKHPTAIFYWLNHRHTAYKNNLVVTQNTQGNLTEEEIDNLSELLFEQETFKEGQKLLTSYVFHGKINQEYASLVLRMLTSQIRAQDIFSRQDENHILNEVMFRKNRKVKKQHG